MKLAHTYDHHNALSEWERRDEYEWLTDIFEAPEIKVQPKCTTEIRQYVANEFKKAGWALDVRINQDAQLSVFALKDDLAFQLQTGNMSRAPYDLLKLQYLYQANKIECAALAVPTKLGANKIADNLANAERIGKELAIFDRVITVPILLVSFE